MKNEIALKVKNNTNLPQKISIMGGLQNPDNGANAKTLSVWTYVSPSFANAGRVEIQAKSINQVDYETYSANISSVSIGSVTDALNSMQIGLFSNYGGNIYTFSDYNEYRNLGITTAAYNFDSFMIQAKAFFDPSDSFYTFSGVDFITFYSDTFFNALYSVQGAMDAYFTYGMGVFYPVSGNQASATGIGSNIQLASIAQKATPMEPKAIYFDGINVVSSDVYLAVPTDNVTNVILFAPSGDFLETQSFLTNGIPSYVNYFNGTYWDMQNFNTYCSTQGKQTVMYYSTYLSSLTSLLTIQINNNEPASTPIVYNSGDKFPDVSNPNVFSILLNYNSAYYASPSTADDFNLGTVPNIGYYTIFNMGTALFPVNLDLAMSVIGNSIYNLQLVDVAIDIIKSSFNTYFSTRMQFGTIYIKSSLYDSTFEDLITPINSGDADNFRINAGLSNFPPIAKIGRQDTLLLKYNLGVLDLKQNKLPPSVINQVLIDMDNYVSTLVGLGYSIIASAFPQIDLSTQSPAAPPFGAGIVAKNNLIGYGLNVVTD